jgi:tripartite-type tricarboxylate transporter receptor subunit TctC
LSIPRVRHAPDESLEKKFANKKADFPDCAGTFRRHRASTNFPSRQITLIVPFPPSGSTDAVARIMAERMRPRLGQPVIIENVGGAGGSIGVGRAARAAPDGYTINIGQWDTHVGSVICSLNYDLQGGFEPIGLLSINPQLMVGKKVYQR